MTQNPQAVRIATPNDIEALRSIVPGIIAENNVLPPSALRIEMMIQRCVHRSPGIAGIIEGADRNVAATIGICPASDPTSDVPYFMAIWCGLAPSVRKDEKNLPLDDPRRHYGKRLFEFARWFHSGMEELEKHPVLLRFDVLTRSDLGPKMNWFGRNLTQVGGSFALGALGSFKQQEFAEAEIAA